MKRKLLFPEKLMLGDGNTPFNVVSTIRIKGAISEDRLHLALAKVQAKHPLLRACITVDEFVVQEHPPAIPVTIIEGNYDDDWIEATKAELGLAFDTSRGPLARITWIQHSTFSDIIFTVHHCMCDGGGRWALLKEIVALLDNPSLDIGMHHSLITIEDIVPRAQRKGMSWLKALFLGLLIRYGTQLLGALVSTKNKSKTNREKDYIIHWKLDEATSSAFARHCAYLGVTVNTALCVALAIAFRQVKGEQGAAKVTCPVDIRKYVPGITKDSIFAVGLSITLDIHAAPARPFWAQVQLLQPIASDKQKRLNTFMVQALEYAHAAIPAMIKFLTYGKLNYNLMFSNMGKLDIPGHFEAFEIETVFSPAVIGPFANPNTVLTCTYKGQMDFTFVSNDDFLEYAEADAIKTAFLQLIQEVTPITVLTI